MLVTLSPEDHLSIWTSMSSLVPKLGHMQLTHYTLKDDAMLLLPFQTLLDLHFFFHLTLDPSHNLTPPTFGEMAIWVKHVYVVTHVKLQADGRDFLKSSLSLSLHLSSLSWSFQRTLLWKDCHPVSFNPYFGLNSHFKVLTCRTRQKSYSLQTPHVERVFSRGRIVLSHLHNRLSVQTTRALMCLDVWSVLGYVKDHHLTPVTSLPDLEDGAEEEGIEEGWDMVV